LALTTPGTVLGTVGYMSPEQTLGGDVDARTDVFSFGVVLYEMLSGYRPYPGSSRQEVAVNLLRSTPQPISLLCPDVPNKPAIHRVTQCVMSVKERRVRFTRKFLRYTCILVVGTAAPVLLRSSRASSIAIFIRLQLCPRFQTRICLGVRCLCSRLPLARCSSVASSQLSYLLLVRRKRLRRRWARRPYP